MSEWPWSADTDPVEKVKPESSWNKTWSNIVDTRTKVWDDIHKNLQPDDSLRWVLDKYMC